MNFWTEFFCNKKPYVCKIIFTGFCSQQLFGGNEAVLFSSFVARGRGTEDTQGGVCDSTHFSGQVTDRRRIVLHWSCCFIRTKTVIIGGPMLTTFQKTTPSISTDHVLRGVFMCTLCLANLEIYVEMLTLQMPQSSMPLKLSTMVQKHKESANEARQSS